MSKKSLSITELHLDAPDALSLFDNVKHQEWAVLLDSGGHDEGVSGYSIVTHSPVITVEFCNDALSIKQLKDEFTLPNIAHDSNVFDSLTQLHNHLTQQIDVKNVNTALPFLCGWLGMFGYDLNVATDKVSATGADEYQLPSTALGFYANAMIFEHATGRAFHCSLDGMQPNWLRELLAETPSDNGFHLTSQWQSNLSKQAYIKQLEKVHQYLKAGDCYQINFAQRFSANYEGSEYEAFKLLRENNKAPFSSFIKTSTGAVLSLSPERFISLSQGHVQTKPIKGTRPRSEDPIEDELLGQELLTAEKDRAENLMIVDLLRNDLSKHCKPHSVKVPSLFALESYPAVHHMVSTVTGELREDASPFDLLKGAFPGGSITGCPKVRAMQIIDELEPNKRSIYCGSIGYIGIRNDMDTNICIRTLLAENGNIYCWAGGGIVIDSVPEEEYQESLDKVAKILPILAEPLA